MKTRRVILLILFLFFYCSRDVSAQDSSLPKSVLILGQKLVLKENKGDAEQGVLAEYISSKETFNNWTLMYAVRFTPGSDLDPKKSAELTKKKVFEKRANGDFLANGEVFEHEATHSYAVDFMLSGPDRAYIEHNIMRYFKSPKGLVNVQIARREYDEEKRSDFIRSIAARRNKLFEEIVRADLPVTNLAK